MSIFRKATKSQTRLRMALFGSSKSGKTYTSISIGSHLAGPNGRVAVVDTEHGSASKYSDEFAFDVVELANFDPRSYIEVIQAAEAANYDVLVIDSLSHEWVGKGGALELADKGAERYRNNSFAAWKDVTPLHNALIEAIVRCRCHLIATMRAKTDYLVQKNERGFAEPVKVGLGPVQRDGMEYEFDILGRMTEKHSLVIEGSRCKALDGQVIERPGKQVAEMLRSWLSDGDQPVAATALVTSLDPGIAADLRNMLRQANVSPEQQRSMLARRGVLSIEELSEVDARHIVNTLKAQVGLYPFQEPGDPVAPNTGEGVAEKMAAAAEESAAQQVGGQSPASNPEDYELANATRPDRNAAPANGDASSNHAVSVTPEAVAG